MSHEPQIFRNILLCYDDRPAANPQNVMDLKKRLIRSGYFVMEYNGQPFEEDATFKVHGIDKETYDKVNNCIAMVVCCSRELKNNLFCKTLTRYARGRRETTTRQMPELLFTMMQGSYTTQSHPFSIDGWLKWFVKDTLWYPMWNKPYIKGAGEAIPQAIMLKRKQITVDFGPDLRGLSTSQRSRSPSRSPSSKGRLMTADSPTRSRFGLGQTEPDPGISNKYDDAFDVEATDEKGSSPSANAGDTIEPDANYGAEAKDDGDRPSARIDSR